MKRRQFLSGLAASPLLMGINGCSLPSKESSYLYHGRVVDSEPLKMIGSGLKIQKLETFTKGDISIVRLTTNDGSEGYGQISTYDADISAKVLHRRLAGQVLGKDPVNIDNIVDACIESSYKYPWSYSCRALTGIDTAIWDLYGKLNKKPVVELLGGRVQSYKAYASSMSRSITPKDESDRIKRLQNEQGFEAFKVRIGKENGHNQDTSLGRTDAIITAVREAVSDNTYLIVDANSCYTPDKAIEVGRLLEEHGYNQFEEPCPYWELEWTRDVTEALHISVSGGEQDNDLAQWRRMINMHAVDIIQPDVCYIGGLTRTLRAAHLADLVGISCVPHSANHSMVTVFALHLLGAIPNAAPYLEYTIEYESNINQQAYKVFSPKLEVKDGAVAIPAEPGWGVQIHDEWLGNADYEKSEL